MKQASLKLKMHMSNVSIINNTSIERIVLNSMLCSFGVLALLYILFLGNMVFNIVERRSLETDARVLSGEVSDLELNYLSMSSQLDLALSSSMGFKETKINFATRKPLGFGNDNTVKLGKNEI